MVLRLHVPLRLIAIQAILLASVGSAQDPSTAREHLGKEDSTSSRRLSIRERETLLLLTSEQTAAFAAGKPASEIVLATGRTLEEFLASKGAEPFELSWYSIDAGAGTLSGGGNVSLNGILAQSDAGAMSGGNLSLTGGFLASEQLDYCQGPGVVFCDGFESGDTSSWE
jgi:hypothetical protein